VSGDIVATGLINTDMPLIRYRTQDTASIAGNEESCLCLRSLPIIKSLDGRSDDVLYTQDGKRIGRLDPVFKANLPVVEAQIIQESLNLFRVLIVPTDGYTWEAGQSIADLIKERIGEGEVHVETVSNIPRGTNGKFRAVVNNLPKAEMERLNKYQ
jgi:phenylacetate-CoA ligase